MPYLRRNNGFWPVRPLLPNRTHHHCQRSVYSMAFPLNIVPLGIDARTRTVDASRSATDVDYVGSVLIMEDQCRLPAGAETVGEMTRVQLGSSDQGAVPRQIARRPNCREFRLFVARPAMTEAALRQ